MRQHKKDTIYMQMAADQSKLATCPRASVGALILSPGGRVISTGYNGAPPGHAHCNPCVMIDGHCVNATHAEMNAILHAGADLKGCTLYVTHFPCLHCSRAIAQVGIRRVVYLREYRSDDRPVDFLEGIEVERLKLELMG